MKNLHSNHYVRRYALSLLMICCGLNCFSQQGPNGRPGDSNQNAMTLNVIIQQDATLGKKLQEQSDNLNKVNRGGILSSMASGLLSNGVNIAVSIVDKALETGVDALIKLSKGHHDDWKKLNQQENMRKDSFLMKTEIKDFYSEFSDKGALDPKGMQFHGLTIEQKQGNNTVLRLVTHVADTPEDLKKILAHTKFTLVVDTLLLDVKHCGLPQRKNITDSQYTEYQKELKDYKERKPQTDNKEDLKKYESQKPKIQEENVPFSFKDRKSVSQKIHIDFYTSYVSPAIEFFKDVKLGSFDINLNGIDSTAIGADGFFRYIRGENTMNNEKPAPIGMGDRGGIPNDMRITQSKMEEHEKVSITGDCFIVPRSYNAMRDPDKADDGYSDIYGLGEYKVNVYLVTSCQNTEDFEKNWKNDWRNYKDYQKKFKRTGGQQREADKNWFVQYYDQNKKQWIVSFITAPVNASANYLNQIVNQSLQVNQTGGQGGQQGGMQGGQQNGQQQNGQPNGGNPDGGMPM